jgi:hypothetical protein
MLRLIKNVFMGAGLVGMASATIAAEIVRESTWFWALLAACIAWGLLWEALPGGSLHAALWPGPEKSP